MSKAGCDYLQASPEELFTLGPAYFSAKHFREDEMKWIAEGFMSMLDTGDQIAGL